ncbi:NUDIX hydrolase [Hydrogenophaga sp.]|uniref:NUDIX hydrolase n=1 Tax=Hydrogenophaga sp. TaxID=1904254 RepID=UPI0026327CC0|nr:NUDIX hydrolase [Hydrogenophaga sp.]MCW5654326.1 NUDIX hydrolase [Hydrogenophaga sp.]
MNSSNYRFCPQCAHPLAMLGLEEDSGLVERLRCAACGFTHWNNPTPVLAGIVELDGRILLARNAAWTNPDMYALITGFMEAGETPEDGIRREIAEETSLVVDELSLVAVHDFQRMNQVIITYHARAHGTVKLSPELVDYRLSPPEEVRCWRAGTGLALAQWLRGRGIEPRFRDDPPRPVAASPAT